MLLDYAQNTQAAVIALVQGNAFSEARRIVRCACFRLFITADGCARSACTQNQTCWRKSYIRRRWRAGRRYQRI